MPLWVSRCGGCWTRPVCISKARGLFRGCFAAAAASDFLDTQKVTKEPPRDELRMSASRSYSLTPWTPILRGPPIRKLLHHRKGAGGQGIGYRSMTAAAEFPVTFGWSSSWREARLLGRWGSSAAQMDGGRPSVPPLQVGAISSWRSTTKAAPTAL